MKRRPVGSPKVSSKTKPERQEMSFPLNTSATIWTFAPVAGITEDSVVKDGV